MPKITELYAYIAEDQGPDDEGVAGMLTSEGWMPLVGADVARVESIRQAARNVAKLTGKRLRLCRFSVREEVEVIEP